MLARYALNPFSAYTVGFDVYAQTALEDAGILQVYRDALDLSSEAGRVRLSHHLLVACTRPAARRLLGVLYVPKGRPWSVTFAQTADVKVWRWLSRRERRDFPVLALQGLGRYLTVRASILDDFPKLIHTPVRGQTVVEGAPRPETRGDRQFGPWEHLVRVLAAYNVEQYEQVLRWPLREALLAFEHRAQEQVRTEYRHAVSVYAALAPYARRGKLKPPRVPRLLREE